MKNYAADSGIISQPDKSSKEKNLLTTLQIWLQEAENSTSEVNYRTEEKEDFAFYAGDQDSAEIKTLLEIAKRPTTVYNEIKPKIDMLVGLAAQIREVPTLTPEGAEDEIFVELQNGVFKYNRREMKLARREMECFDHAMKGGRSFLHFYVSGENPFEPELKAKLIAGRDCRTDPCGKEYDLSDHRFFFTDKWMTVEDIAVLWPNFSKETATVLSQESISKGSYFDEARRMFRIVECWYRGYEKVFWFINPVTGQPDCLDEKRLESFKKALKEGGIPTPDGRRLPPIKEELPTTMKMRKIVRYAHFSGGVLLDYADTPYTHPLLRNEFPYILFGAYKNEEENRWFSVINMMKDPQRGLNTTRRQLVHLLQTAPKGILIHEVGAIINEEEYDRRSSEPNFRLQVAPGKMDKIKFSTQPQISPIYGQLDTLFVQTLKDISGIQDSLLGIQTSSREPGITVKMRQETGIAVLYVLFTNFRDSRLNAAKFAFGLQQMYTTQNKILRIEGPNGQMLRQMNSQLNPEIEGFNDVRAGQFDVVIDEDVENITMRSFILQMLVQFSQNNPGSIPPDLIMEYTNLPYSAKQKVKQWQIDMMKREDEKFKMEIEAKTKSSSKEE